MRVKGYGQYGKLLIQYYIKYHHKGKTDSKTDRPKIGVSILGCFKYKLFNHYIHHCSRTKNLELFISYSKVRLK